ncbi:hypothetical protein RSOLAG1IB_06046 [Rhizoctonia solani AG-1 IB]|uniref:Uncharacterized protein n=1 Tax=Thanatephorus cucumeris (strain AG1-IB / isolate 7/3/14) TaxID=1108050 RepID=A0A0B7F9V0_THACB|nr:hypothetical protein RSOLAG1IB_06046 [Rhizoctonia solani AG-1 IB]
MAAPCGVSRSRLSCKYSIMSAETGGRGGRLDVVGANLATPLSVPDMWFATVPPAADPACDAAKAQRTVSLAGRRSFRDYGGVRSELLPRTIWSEGLWLLRVDRCE